MVGLEVYMIKGRWLFKNMQINKAFHRVLKRNLH